VQERLSTDRGHTLRAWELSDASAVVAAFDDPLMSSQTSAPLTTEDDAQSWISEHLERWHAGTAFSWAIASEELLVGSVTVGAINHRHRIAWMSYWTTASSRGTGVASSALRCASDWAFRELQLFRLELGHRTNNPASCRVALAAGFIPEGIERQKLEYAGLRYDVELHARLVSDPAPVAS